MLGVIANPFAGKRWRQLDAIHDYCNSYGIPFVMTDHTSEITDAIIRLVNGELVTVLAIYGGDGTLQQVVDALIKQHDLGVITNIPIIVTLGGGTQDAVHRQYLGWRKKPIQILERVHTHDAELRANFIKPIRISYTDLKSKKPVFIYGFTFIIGAASKVIEQYEEDGKSKIMGLWYMIKAAGSILFGTNGPTGRMTKPIPIHLKVDGKTSNHKRTFSLFASATNKLIYGIDMFVGQTDERSFYGLTYDVSARTVLWLFPLGVRKWYVPKSPEFYNLPTQKFEFTTTDSLIHLDAEFFYSKPGTSITIEPGPEICLVEAF